ncbi:MAG: serine/threonine protein kinase [Rhodobiaceae bacterium]|nr:serine/threonine protein kinase [Rhodobiaceae bacterium]MCC0042134.1 serine/threonine protein kinase [Rhodobiaceae bacterium]
MRQQKDAKLAEIEHGIAENADPAGLLRILNAVEEAGAFPDPLPPAVLRAKAVLQNRLGLPENAILHLAEARQHDRDDPDAWKTSRELATIHAWRGDVDRANTELIRAMVQARTAAIADAQPLLFADAGRVCLERGDPDTGALCFSAALAGMQAGEREQVRAAIGHIQCLNLIGDVAGARRAIEQAAAHVGTHNVRLRYLFALEQARQRSVSGDAAGCEAALEAAGSLLPQDPAAWEHVEHALVRFEVTQTVGHDAADIDELREVIARLEEDQLYIQEALMRLALASVLKDADRFEEAIAEAARALRLAVRLANQRCIYRARTMLIDIAGEAGLEDAGDLENLPLSARYVPASQLGQGGYGTVYRAIDTETGTQVAIKIISMRAIADPGERSRQMDDVRGELRASRAVVNPHVARVLETFASEGDLVMVQELISGGELDANLVARLPRGKLLELLSKVAFGLAALHGAGVVHRDIKPENVLVRADGSPVIVDFGLAGNAGESEGDTLRGTRDYMAPELLRPRADRLYAPASDAYAFGIMLRWALGEEADAGGGWFRRGGRREGAAGLIGELTERDAARRLCDLGEAGRRLAELAQAADA